MNGRLAASAGGRTSDKGESGVAAMREAEAYRPDIDGLRAIAVIAVVLFHAYPAVLRGGFVGVDVFFVISGFLISGIVFRHLDRGDWSVRDFYARRIRRIFPATLVVVAAVLAYGFVVMLPSERAQLGKHVAASGLFAANFVFWNEAGYFDRDAAFKPLLHLWSLGVEEQFYVIWPAVLWSLVRFRLPVLASLIAITAASFALNIATAAFDPTADFFSPLTRTWELSVGGLLAYRQPAASFGRFAIPRRGMQPAELVGLGLILLAIAVLHEGVPYPGWRALLPVGGAALVVVAGSTGMNQILTWPPLVLLGRVSFPFYLWHWPLLSFATIVRQRAPTPLLALILLLGSLVLAVVTTRWVETPIRFGRNSVRNTGLLAAAMTVLVLVGLGVWRLPSTGSELSARQTARIDLAINDAVFLPTADMTVTKVDRITVARIGSGAEKVLFVGDSVLFHYGPRVQKLFDDGRLTKTVIFVVGPSCSPIPGAPRLDTFAQCSAMSGIANSIIDREKVGTVIFGALWQANRGSDVFVTRDGTRMPIETAAARNSVYANLEDEVRRLRKKGIQVALILETPTSDLFNPGRMVSRSATGYRVDPQAFAGVPMATLMADRESDDRSLIEIARRTGAEIIDPLPAICGTGSVCEPFFGADEPKFADQLHLRPIFVRDQIHFLDPLLTSGP